MKAGSTIKNMRGYRQAKKYLVGGVDSPLRSFRYTGSPPLFAHRGQGSRLYDCAGHDYIDYVLSYGALLLGHAHPAVIRKTAAALKRGFSFGLTNEKEIALAKVIVEAVGFAEKIRFVNSGTEAVMTAVRLARAATKKNKVIMFRHAYHGHADYLLKDAGSGMLATGKSFSAGVPADFVKQTIIVDRNDLTSLTNIFDIYGRDIAAVIVEPVGGNYGVLEPNIDFLKQLRKITKRHKAMLIFDEVITGFRFLFGSFSQIAGIEPDLICLGKIIGGGLPIGAVAGRAVLMDWLSPLGNVYQASTFAGNPIVMQAGLTTLEILGKRPDNYKKINNYAQDIARGIEESAQNNAVAIAVTQYGSMFSLRFSRQNIFSKFYKILLSRGIFFAPSEFESNFVSFAHSRKNIDDTIKAVSYALARISRQENNG